MASKVRGAELLCTNVLARAHTSAFPNDGSWGRQNSLTRLGGTSLYLCETLNVRVKGTDDEVSERKMTVPLRREAAPSSSPSPRAAETTNAFGSGARPIAVPPTSIAVPSTRASSAPASYRLREGQTASDEPSRSLRPGVEGRGASARFKPDRLFQAARLCLKQNRLDDAVLLIRQACAAEPEQYQYLALHAWLRVLRGELKPGPTGESILDVLNRAARARPVDVDIRMYRAHALQRLGRGEEAYRDFCFVAKVDRLNVEAVRAVRSYHETQGSVKPSPVK